MQQDMSVRGAFWDISFGDQPFDTIDQIKSRIAINQNKFSGL